MTYFCCEARRRELVRRHATLNGIDFLEVLDSAAPAGSPRQRTLLVRCLKPLRQLTASNVCITGGERITAINVQWAFPASAIPISPLVSVAERNLFNALPDADHVLVVRTESAGDFSTYRLSLVRSQSDPGPPADFDPLLSVVDFSFKVECPSALDCKAERVCPTRPEAKPAIDYLAKEYASFRQLMLDRMAVLVPEWQERNPADLGVALVELLAYVGDHLSYYQDAVATEAYLGTARKRTSIRRHARLVDYHMHDGCNARAWVQVQCGADEITLPQGTPLFTRVPGLDRCITPGSPDHERALAAGPEVFETMHPLTLRAAHNEMRFHTWGDERSCLPRGAVRATLRNEGNRLEHLRRGDVLIFEEVRGSETGHPQDAGAAHRHAVRLTAVRFAEDPLSTEHPERPEPLRVVEIEWSPTDALPFPLCLWETDDPAGPGTKQPVSIARGNVVLADHGRTVVREDLGETPPPSLFRTTTGSDPCADRPPLPVHPRFRPRLRQRPLTQVAPFDPQAPAASAFRGALHRAAPAISFNDQTWQPQRDLLFSDGFDQRFVVEMEQDGLATLRFGDDRHGRRPPPGTRFEATYRVGNGTQGNVGAEALYHVVSADSEILAVRNPLPARGGEEPETNEQVRQNAPSAFRTQERAVTAADYAEAAQRYPGVQRAAATLCWTGSWHTVFVSVDRFGGLPVDAAFRNEMRQHLERFRLARHDVEVDGPRHVSLEIDMTVCVRPEHFRRDIGAALRELFSNRVLSDGRRGQFHPDNFTFGQPVYLSPLYAAAQAVEGVAAAEITTFQRQGTPSREALDLGRLDLGRLEMARLENNPNFPERGVFRLRLEGGK